MNNDSSRNVLISGAASGIGKAVAAALLGDGHKITAVDVNAESLASAKQELGPNERVHFVPADITSGAPKIWAISIERRKSSCPAFRSDWVLPTRLQMPSMHETPSGESLRYASYSFGCYWIVCKGNGDKFNRI